MKKADIKVEEVLEAIKGLSDQGRAAIMEILAIKVEMILKRDLIQKRKSPHK